MLPPTGCKIPIPCNVAILVKKQKWQDAEFSYCELQNPIIDDERWMPASWNVPF
jgi:hypothetical protein